MVVFLSHGEAGDLIVARDGTFPLYPIMQKFTANQLPEMATRPKIFLVQACRGKGIDQGQYISNISTPDFLDSTGGEGSQTIKYPNYADIAIGFSSHHGHFAHRNKRGSWYIQEFCNVIENIDPNENDLIDIFVKTNKRVATRISRCEEVELDEKKQISSFYATLTKDFYFVKKELRKKRQRFE